MYKIKLSPYSKIFYTEWLLSPNSSRYNLSIDQILYGVLDVDRLRNALKRYVTEHLILNSHIQNIDGEPYWVKNNNINELEYSSDPISVSELLSYVSSNFDLHNEPLYRFRLLRISRNVHRLIIVFYHMVVDGSASLDTGVFEAISNYYNDENHVAKYNSDDQIKLISSLADTLSTNLVQNKDKYKEFWYQQLSDIESIDLNFLKLGKTFHKQNETKPYNSKREINFSYGDAEFFKLNQIKLKYGITPYAYGRCIFALLLHKYTGQDRLAFSYPIAIKEGSDFIYGTQLNTNLIPYQFKQSTTITDLFDQTKSFYKATLRNDIKHGYYPITNIIQDGANKQLLNIYFTQAFFIEHPFKFDEVTKIEISTELSIEGVTEDILLFEHNIRDNKLNYRVRYDKNAFNEELLNDFVTSYKKLYSEVLNDLSSGNNNQLISGYNFLTQAQYQQVVYEFNKTNKEYPNDKTIHKLFEEQTLKTPNNIAIVYENTKLTYQELNSKANQLAHYLVRNYYIKQNDLIALCLNRSEQMIVAIIGALKSGGAYVPIDPDYPDNRISHILEDAKIKLIITCGEFPKRLKAIGKNAVVIDIDNSQLQKELSEEKKINPQITMPSNNLAYVIYTSGTTGKPKGVLQQHNNVVRLFAATDDWFRFSQDDVWTLYHSYIFDFTVWEICGALFYGGKLVIPTIEQIRDTDLFYELCCKEGVTVLNQTPQVFYRFIYAATRKFNYKRLLSLRYIIFGGEALNFKRLTTWFRLYGYNQPKLINMYGITETTVHVTYKEISEKDIHQGCCIGIAIPDLKLFVLDKNLMPMPVGAQGELYVEGAGLARGYLNQPTLTKEKFIRNPFQTKKERLQNKISRLYKTGDLVRWLLNGELEYMGRNDFQVKIRGYRIELGEIESKLVDYPGIKQTIVLVKERGVGNTGNKFIVAYYVADKELDEVKIHEYLVTQLPEYMLPSILVYLDKLPLTINGKLDRKALPEPIFKSDDKYKAPSNKQEGLICKEYARILRLEKVGVNDDFFKLGGNSLQAITLASALHHRFDINVADVFCYRTPKKLADNLYFGIDVIRQKLEQVKLVYKNRQNSKYSIDALLQNKINYYQDSISNLKMDFSLEKPISNILLTGATGFLGCNILNQLLKLTDYNVFLLIRAPSEKEAIGRINKKFQFYFDKMLGNAHDSRLFIMNGDIEKCDLGLSSEKYRILVEKIDSIIHAAALVKHYGEYDKFYSANVKATINLLELAKLIKLKDFHYISTSSVLNFRSTSNNRKVIYTEDDLPDDTGKNLNVYTSTKLQGEQQIIKYHQNYGISGNIYRVGNMAFMEENCRTQENAEDNAFLNWLRCLLKIRCIAKDIGVIEISQTDLTAQAIIRLFNKEQLSNHIFHVFNPVLFDIFNIFTKDRILSFETLTIEQFVDTIIRCLNKGNYQDLIVRFLLRQGWLDGLNVKNATDLKIFQDRTQYILGCLNFKWSCITGEAFLKYLKLYNLYQKKEQMTKKVNIFESLKILANIIPANVFWLDTNSVVLGLNERTLSAIGGVSSADFIGKTPYEFYSKDIADNIVEHHKEVVTTGEAFSYEESIRDLISGKTKYFNVIIAPLFGDDGKVAGSVGISSEITAEKETERLALETKKQQAKLEEQLKFKKTIDQAAQDTKSNLAILLLLVHQCSGLTRKEVFETIESFAVNAPISLYWFDENNALLGANKLDVELVGSGIHVADYIGKTPYDYFPSDIANNVVKHNNLVMQTGKILSQEESFENLITGETKYCTAFKSPLYNKDGEVIGIICTSVDITTEKNAEHLKLEAERQKAQIEEQKNIIKIVDQVSHDIRSPARTIYALVENNADKLPEELRVPLRETSASIIDVASSLINRYERYDASSGLGEQQAVIASLSLMQILSEKKVQNVGSLVNFTSDYSYDSMFAFIKVQPSHFKRMISNLLNNAIEALDGKKGVVHLGLTTDETKKDIRITIQDNGKGMSEETVNKIKDGATVATDKKEGHGIGLTQIRETIERNRGKFDIVSKLGDGTKIVLTFPMITPPQWLAKEIKLNKGETVVILDDDTGIHTTWDLYFKEYTNDVQLKHFTIANEAINFINTSTKKDNIFLLTDYELMKQGITGIDVIKQTNFFDRAILVTSHYANTKIQKLAVASGIKILPKDLALKISLKICEANEKCSIIDKDGKVDVIVIEDDEMLANSEAVFFESKNKKVDKYYSPDIFLRNISKYDKDTIVCIDNEFIGSTLNGFDVAKQLHEQGFTKLYLLSGREFEKDKIPKYLTAILKTDIDALYSLT